MIRACRALLIGLVAAGVWLNVFSGSASALGNSFPDSADTSGGASVYIVNGETQYVTQTNGKLRVWFPSNTGSITINNGHFCSSNPYDYVESEDGTFASYANGSDVTLFRVNNAGNVTEKFGKKYAANNSNCNDTVTFNFSGSTALTKRESDTNYYYVVLSINYVANANPGRDGGMNYLRISASNGAIIGLPGVPEGETSGYTTTQDQANTSPSYVDYRVPFGTPCSATSNQVAKVILFDIDNQGGGGAQPTNGPPITVKVFNITENQYVNFTGSAGQSWTPPDTQNDTQSITFTAKPQHKYRLEINNVYHNNTIQYSVPFSQIYRMACPPAADLVPKATVKRVDGTGLNGSTIAYTPGLRLVFENWVESKNVNAFVTNSHNFRMNVTGTSGLPGAATWTNSSSSSDRQISPAREPIPSNTGLVRYEYDVPAGFTGTVTYCRQTSIQTTQTPNWVGFPQGTNTQACVTVTSGGSCGTLTINPLQPEPGDAVNVTIAVGGAVGGNSVFTARIYNPSGALVLTRVANNVSGTTETIPNVQGGRYTAVWTYQNATENLPNCTGEFVVYQRPYVVVRGGDVNASLDVGAYLSNTGSTCQAPAGHVTTFTRDYGSGTDVAMYARGSVTDFVSSLRRVSVASPQPPKGLTFANTNATLPYGGSYDDVVGCGPYDNDWRLAASQPAGNSVHNSGYTGPTVMRVNGDVHITGSNVQFPVTFALGSAPSFKVVATGNIYIDKSITRLDGVYMAGGSIYTCTDGATAPSAGSLSSGSQWASCNSSLQMNGALLTPNLRLTRLAGTVSVDGAAESITYNPVLWLQQFNAGGTGELDFDAYTTLPPVL